MITPRFRVSQTAERLVVVAHCPYVRAASVEAAVGRRELRLHAAPYFLALTFSGDLVADADLENLPGGQKHAFEGYHEAAGEGAAGQVGGCAGAGAGGADPKSNGDDDANDAGEGAGEGQACAARYDVDSGELTVELLKRTPGERFEGLDMLTRLLTPAGGGAKAQPRGPLIEEVGGGAPSDEGEGEGDEWRLPQALPEGDVGGGGLALGAPRYGFARGHGGAFAPLGGAAVEVVQLPSPDETPEGERRAAREAAEHERFDPEHYACDVADEDGMVAAAMEERVWWEVHAAGAGGVDADELTARLASASLAEGGGGSGKGEAEAEGCRVRLSEEEREQLLKLPKRTPLVDKGEVAALFLGLVDVCFAYCHEFRVTGGEFSVESATTVAQLAATLSWLELWRSPGEAVLACARRALCYPLLRSWPLALRALRDAAAVLRHGRRGVLRVLLKVRQLMERADEKHLLNRLYLDQYCVWVQGVRSKQLRALADDVDTATDTLSEDDIHLGVSLRRIQAIVQGEDVSDSDDDDTDDSDDGNSNSSSGDGSDEDLPEALLDAREERGRPLIVEL